MNIKSFVIVMALAFISTAAYSQDDEVVNLGTTITGNQEQPKVLYIVPWKQAQDQTILSQSLDSRLADVFDHVERDEHRRELEFVDSLTGSQTDEPTE